CYLVFLRDLLCTTILFMLFLFFFFTYTATTEIYTLSLHDALPILVEHKQWEIHILLVRTASVKCFQLHSERLDCATVKVQVELRSEEHTSELQSRENLVCRLLLEKKNKKAQK